MKTSRSILPGLAGVTFHLVLAAGVAQAAPGYHLFRQLTNLTTGTISEVKVRSQDGKRIAFVSTGDVMGPGTETTERQIYLWEEQADGSGTIIRITNQPGCENYDVARPTDTVLSDRPEVIAFVSTCDHDPSVGNADGNPEIFFYKVVEQTFHQITNTVAPVVNKEPYTSDSGRCMVFASTGDLNNNTPDHIHYDSNHTGPGFSNPDGSQEIFLYGKLDTQGDFPYHGVITQVSNGPAGTTSGHPVINGYWFARQCQTTAFHSDHDQMGNGLVGQGIYIYKMPMNNLELITAAEIPFGFQNGIYRNPNISAASPFARGPHIVFEAEPDLWRNESLGTDIFDWRDFHPRMTQFTNVGSGFWTRDPEVGDGGGVIVFSSNGDLLHPGHDLRTGETPPFNADANSEIMVLYGRRKVVQLTDSVGCTNEKPGISDDGNRIGFISNCDLINGHNAGGAQQIFLYHRERHHYTLIENNTCLEAEACCTYTRREQTCYHPLAGRKLKINRPNCVDRPNGCN